MAKWKAPEDAGAGVSIGGEFFPVVDGHVTTPADGDYFGALSPFGYVEVPDDAVAASVTASPEPVAVPVAAVVAPQPEPAPEPVSEPAPVEPEPKV